jgi:hypothetical protein
MTIRLSEKHLKACMDANNLNTSPVAAEPEVPKTRDAAYDKIVKNAFQEFTRRKYSFIIFWPFSRLWALLFPNDSCLPDNSCGFFELTL